MNIPSHAIYIMMWQRRALLLLLLLEGAMDKGVQKADRHFVI